MSNLFQNYSFDIYYTCWPGQHSWYTDSLWATVLHMLHERTHNIHNTIVAQHILYMLHGVNNNSYVTTFVNL